MSDTTTASVSSEWAASPNYPVASPVAPPCCRSHDSEKPWMLYYSTGCSHAPHHVAKGWSDKYKGPVRPVLSLGGVQATSAWHAVSHKYPRLRRHMHLRVSSRWRALLRMTSNPMIRSVEPAQTKAAICRFAASERAQQPRLLEPRSPSGDELGSSPSTTWISPGHRWSGTSACSPPSPAMIAAPTASTTC